MIFQKPYKFYTKSIDIALENTTNNMFRAITLLLMMVLGNLGVAQIIYVSENGTGAGTSWSDAIGDLQAAITLANPGDELWIAAGVYYPVECDPCTEDQRTISFEIPSSIGLYGGFAGNETEPAQRDIAANPTVLSGDIDRNNLLAGNAETVVYFHNVNEQTILDGFVIEQGYAVLENGPIGERFNSGAAIYNSGVLTGSASHPIIRNCTFRDNYAAGFGGAIFNNGAFGGSTNMQFENCVFINNEAGQGGGAIYNDATFSGIIEQQFSGCIFENNTSSWQGGGAIMNQGSESGFANTTYIECQFKNNVTSGYGGAVLNIGRTGISNAVFSNCDFRENSSNFGGAVANNGTLQGVANTNISNCNFENNYASGDGGALYNWGTEGQSNAHVLESNFRENNTQFAGAGIFNNGIDGESKAMVLSCQFIENVADTYGAAIYNNGRNGDASAEIANCLFLKNRGSSAGAIYNLGSEGGNSSPHITNCTFYGNIANVGGAIYSNANDATGTANPVVTNCIFWENTANFGAIFRNIESTTIVRHSVVDKNNCEALLSGSGAQVDCGAGMFFDIYPMFVDTTNNNLRLSPNSPLLDMGDNSVVENMGLEFDLDHHSRIINTTVDLGAYEYVASFIPLTIAQQPPAQLELCEGSAISLSFEVQGSGPYSFQWFRNALPINNANAQTLSIESLENSANYYCIVTSPYDTIMTNETALSVIPLVYPSVQLNPIDNSFCTGDTVSIDLSFLNAGQQPSFQWYLNGTPISENVSTIEYNNFTNGDLIYASLTPNVQCTEEELYWSDTLALNINPVLTGEIELLGPDSIICSGEPVFFSIEYENGGSDPVFTWYINDDLIADSNVQTYEASTLLDGDIVTVEMHSSEQCVENSIVSDLFLAQVDDCATVSSVETFAEKKINVYPNPSKGTFQVDLNGWEGTSHWQIIDLNGRIIKESTFTPVDYNDSQVLTIAETGIFILVIKNEIYHSVSRILIH